jgi:diaminohydroxyphosphoribosylaminopyrimidine deaminase/5-amino-6-(5-phosphoribosylamino)uracil reductase
LIANRLRTVPHISHALRLAESALYLTSPNPRVGCVLVNPAGHVIGQGHTQMAGGPHAEIMALRDAQSQDQSTQSATAYVTLEPCAHHGRTGPCCDALAQAGIARVVASLQDPNPLVEGQGFARLRAAGIAVEVGTGAKESRELNMGFFSRMQRHRPWMRLKMAASLDVATALDNGKSQWITGAQARTDGHAWRARACAVLTGVGTVLQDKPLLDVRHVQTPRQPMLVIVDSALQTPADAALFGPRRKVLIYAAQPHAAREAALRKSGADIVYLEGPTGEDGRAPKVDLHAMAQDLARRQCNEVHIEAGHQLNGSLLRAGLVDELLVYLAPLWLGQGAGMSNFGPLTELAQGMALDFQSAQRIGPDLRILARVQGQADFQI